MCSEAIQRMIDLHSGQINDVIASSAGVQRQLDRRTEKLEGVIDGLDERCAKDLAWVKGQLAWAFQRTKDLEERHSALVASLDTTEGDEQMVMPASDWDALIDQNAKLVRDIKALEAQVQNERDKRLSAQAAHRAVSNANMGLQNYVNELHDARGFDVV